MTFHIGLGSSTQVNGDLCVNTEGKEDGALNVNYMEDGKRKSITIPLEFVADLQKKILVLKYSKEKMLKRTS